MTNKNEQPKSKIPIFIIGFCSALTSFLIQVFLSGKIIDIPHGTHEGGIMSGIGVATIIIFMAIITFLIWLLINFKKTK